MTGLGFTPAYLLRRRIVLRAVRGLPPGRALDVGCGNGELLVQLDRRGWECVGLEPSPAAAAAARRLVAAAGMAAEVLEDSAAVRGRFSLVLATEVLEHLEDDVGALRGWRSWLAPGGALVLTVPAHPGLWGPSDDHVGHLRRYDRAGVRRIAEEAGLRVEELWSFGFPLGSLTLRLRRRLDRRRARGDRTRSERVAASSFESRLPAGRLAAAALELLGALGHALQLPFRRADVGTSYLAVCRDGARPREAP